MFQLTQEHRFSPVSKIPSRESSTMPVHENTCWRRPCGASCWMCSYLVGVVEEVHRHAERQGVMIGVSEQDGQDLHTGRPGLPLALLLSAFHRALAVNGILPHLSPDDNIAQRWYPAGVIQHLPWPQPQPGAIGQEAGTHPGPTDLNTHRAPPHSHLVLYKKLPKNGRPGFTLYVLSTVFSAL